MPLTFRLDAANYARAADAAEDWYSAASAIWDSDPTNPHPHVPAAVRELETAYQTALARCSEAAKVLVAFFVFDQPLPGDLGDRLEAGERFSTEELLKKIHDLLPPLDGDSDSSWDDEAAPPPLAYEDRVCTTCKEPFVSAPGLARWLCDMCFKHTLVHDHSCDETREHCFCRGVLLYIEDRDATSAW